MPLTTKQMQKLNRDLDKGTAQGKSDALETVGAFGKSKKTPDTNVSAGTNLGRDLGRDYERVPNYLDDDDDLSPWREDKRWYCNYAN
jgi:hypothetical protein